MSHFKHKTPIQLRFKDLDAMGHVNNANHLTYIELARTDYFNEVLGSLVNWSTMGIILARVEVDFKHPILLNDKLTVLTKCTRIGNKSFDLSYRIVKSDRGESIEMARLFTVMVCFDYVKKMPIAFPPEWREVIEAYEK